MRDTFRSCAAVAVAVACLAIAIRAQDDTTRSIVAEKFLKARPAPASTAPPRPATYRPAPRPGSGQAGPVKTPAKGETVELGITVWRLRPSKAGDAARLLVQDKDATTEWTPERVPVGAPLAAGDRVRLSIESPRAGYLYVVDREQYADGTSGEPFLIFPTSRTRGGENAVAGGRLIDLPSQEDRPPFFTMRPSRADQTGERLTILVTEHPLPGLTIGAEPVRLSPAVVADWEAKGAASVERLEMVGGAGRAWSRAEQRAGSDATRLLRQDDPPPQTLFRVVVRQADLVAVNVVLSQGSTGRRHK